MIMWRKNVIGNSWSKPDSSAHCSRTPPHRSATVSSSTSCRTGKGRDQSDLCRRPFMAKLLRLVCGPAALPGGVRMRQVLALLLWPGLTVLAAAKDVNLKTEANVMVELTLT